MADFPKLLGPTLIDNKGTESKSTALTGKDAVMLYFSAHWCGPCRQFTPQLIKTYNKLKQEKKSVECVFVSSDNDEKSFDEYFGSMPWLALPYSARDKKGELSQKFKVRGIPTLVILDGKTGAPITLDGRAAVMQDPEGKKFPWTPPSFKEILGDSFTNNKGDKLTGKDIAGKNLGFYFSGHWCGPCRQFTPQLIKTYNKLKAAKKDFEIIFVSSDHDQNGFDTYLKEMPWIAIPFSDDDRRSALSERFGVEGIPTFVMVDSSGKTINKGARGEVSADPEGANFPWAPKSVNDLLPDKAGSLNEGPGLIVFMPEKSDPALEQKVTQALKPEADKILKAAMAAEEDPSMNFFVAKDHPIVGQVKHLMEMGGDGSNKDTVMAILDVTQGGSFHAKQKKIEEINADVVCKFLVDFKAGKLTKTPLHTHSHGGH